MFRKRETKAVCKMWRQKYPTVQKARTPRPTLRQYFCIYRLLYSAPLRWNFRFRVTMKYPKCSDLLLGLNKARPISLNHYHQGRRSRFPDNPVEELTHKLTIPNK
ncbi:hypothetical protein LOAG_01184 [Loa loa]|uniref:Uncharacterized protein n=1 Tax=Loa loa TaxID=7209 RepID=A0A1S0U9G2_LOALO|nr:hypothetical protein LOAG_01184 [Loa loa]EFO27301.1 hypothetical protein LOAG_01184 [Loa loa]